MTDTLVLQSHRSPLPYRWIEACLDSVQLWVDASKFEYRFVGDELFQAVPAELLQKTRDQVVIASDLARLLLLRDGLQDYDTVVWFDADTLVFDAARLQLPDSPYAVGREVWVQQDKSGNLKAYKKVHNAFLMFRKGNTFLDYYIDSAMQLLQDNRGTMPPQFIGPKLLTAWHNIVAMPVLETAGMLSPPVISDMLQGKGPALDLFREQSPAPIAAANLCISSCHNKEVTEKQMEQLIDAMLNR